MLILNFMNSIYNKKFLEHADCYYELENVNLHKQNMNISVSAKLHYSDIFLLKDFSLKRIWERLEYPEALRLKTIYFVYK